MSNTIKTEPVAPETNTFVWVRTITATRWKNVETAFYEQVEVTRLGTIKNLRGGILAALHVLLMG